MKPRVFITGASGFVGSALCRELGKTCDVLAAVRTDPAASRLPDGVRAVTIGDLVTSPGLVAHLDGVDCVIHLAARVHILNDGAEDPLAAFRETNVLGTVRLAEAAIQAKVPQFIYMSSIGVNGGDSGKSFFSEDDSPRPHTPYAVSKLEAETALRRLASESAVIITMLRPPLVYGPNAPGNLARLVSAVSAGMPLPLASVHNQRSLIYVGNLVDAIANLVHAPPDSSEVYLVADNEAVSTPELITLIGKQLGRRARLVAMPVALLRFVARLAGKAREVDQLAGSLVVSTKKFRSRRSWNPPTSLEQGLALSIGSGIVRQESA